MRKENLWSAGLLLLASCIVTPIETPETGFLTVLWRIEDRSDDSICNRRDVEEVQLTVYDETGSIEFQGHEVCRNFGMSVELFEGRYDAVAVLRDFRNEDASDEAELKDLRIISDTDLTFNVNFP